MSNDLQSMNNGARLVMGLVCIAFGAYPLGAGLGVFPIDMQTVYAPLWVVAVVGLILMIVGLMIVLGHRARANDFFAGILLLLFAAIGAWVAVFSSGDGMSGGLPFISREANIMLGRSLFGFGALICVAMSVYAFRRAASR